MQYLVVGSAVATAKQAHMDEQRIQILNIAAVIKGFGMMQGRVDILFFNVSILGGV